MTQCDATGESLYEVPSGEIRTMCITFAICDVCGRVYSGHRVKVMATGTLGKHGENSLYREYKIVGGDGLCPPLCGHFNVIKAHNSHDGIPAVLPEMVQVHAGM